MQFWIARNRFDYNYRKIVAVTLIEYIANPIIGIMFVLQSQDKASARILSIVLVECIFYGCIAFNQYRRGKYFFVREYWKYALLFNLPLLPHYLSGQILSQSDRVMIKQFVGYSSVAMYSVAYNVGMLMNIFVTAINGSYTPWFYQNIKEGRRKDIYRTSSVLSILMSILVGILMIFGPEVIYIVAPKEYASSAYVIPPVAASVFFMFIYNLFANVEFYYEENKFVMYGSIIAAFMNLLLNYIFLPRYGYVAAAYTTLFCYMVYAFMHYVFSRHIQKRKGIDNGLFNLRLITILSATVLIEVVVSSYLYQYTGLRLCIIIVLITMCILFHKQIIRQSKMVLRLKHTNNN